MITKLILLSVQILLTFAFIHANTSYTEYYTTEPNDTLFLIAEKMYSDPDFWPVIYAANKAKLSSSSPHASVEESLKLRVPPTSACREFGFPECRDKVTAQSNPVEATSDIATCTGTSSKRSFELTIQNDLPLSLGSPQRYLQKGQVERFPRATISSSDVLVVTQGTSTSTYGVISFQILGDINMLSIMWSVPQSSDFENFISVYYGPESAGPELLDAMYKNKLSNATSAKDTWKTYQLADGLLAEVSMTDTGSCVGTVHFYTQYPSIKDGVYVIRDKNSNEVMEFSDEATNLVRFAQYNSDNVAQRFYVKNIGAQQKNGVVRYVIFNVASKRYLYSDYGFTQAPFSWNIYAFWSIRSDYGGNDNLRLFNHNGNGNDYTFVFDPIE